MLNTTIDHQVASDQPVAFNMQERVDQALNFGFEIDISRSIKAAWALFKEDGGAIVGYWALLTFGGMVAGGIPLIGFLVSIAVGVCRRVLYVGYAIYTQKIYKGHDRKFEDCFKGFTNAGQLIIAALLIGAMLMVCFTIPVGIWAVEIDWFSFNESDVDPQFILDAMGAVGMGLIPALLIQILFSWTNYLIWFGNFSFAQAMGASAKLITRKFGSFVVLYLALLGINLLGFLCFGVGLIATIPLSFMILYVVFEHAIGTPGEVQDDFDELTDRTN